MNAPIHLATNTSAAQARPGMLAGVKSIVRAALAAASLSVLALACEPPRATNPLPDRAKEPDKRLVGIWAGDVDHSLTSVTVVASTGGAIDLVIVGDDGFHGAMVLGFDGFTSTFAGTNYLSLRQKAWPEGFDNQPKLLPDWIFARYDLGADGSMTLWRMEEAPVKAAVESKKLAGKIQDGDVRLSASSEELAAFVKTAGPKLWSKIGVFKKAAAPKR